MDDCNTCVCHNGVWACTLMLCPGKKSKVSYKIFRASLTGGSCRGGSACWMVIGRGGRFCSGVSYVDSSGIDSDSSGVKHQYRESAWVCLNEKFLELV